MLNEPHGDYRIFSVNSHVKMGGLGLAAKTKLLTVVPSDSTPVGLQSKQEDIEQ